jgi:hypothetical protein
MIDRLGKAISGGVGLTIDRIGYASIGGGLGLWINSESKAHSIASYILPSWPQEWAEWAAAGSTIGALTFAAKNIVDVYLKAKRKRGDSNVDDSGD